MLEDHDGLRVVHQQEEVVPSGRIARRGWRFTVSDSISRGLGEFPDLHALGISALREDESDEWDKECF